MCLYPFSHGHCSVSLTCYHAQLLRQHSSFFPGCRRCHIERLQNILLRRSHRVINPVHAVLLPDELYLVQFLQRCRHGHIILLFLQFFQPVLETRINLIPDNKCHKLNEYLCLRRLVVICQTALTQPSSRLHCSMVWNKPTHLQMSPVFQNQLIYDILTALVHYDEIVSVPIHELDVGFTEVPSVKDEPCILITIRRSLFKHKPKL